MVGGEQGMPTPEQERPLSAEQARQPSFEERLRGLIEPKKDEEGKVLQEAAIRNEKLQRLGRLALESRNQTPEGLGKLLGKGDDWCLDEQVPEEEWSVLAGELSEERERLLREQEVSEEGGEALEKKARKEGLFGQNIEPYLGAVFEKGRYESYIRTGQISRETNIVLDVTNPRDRERWLLENIRAAMDGTIPNPEETWKSIVDFWRLDFSEAARREKLSFEEREEFDREIRSAMAICASARAMEQSDGAAATYLGFITQSSPDNLYLDRQDDWSEYLLHGDEGKIKKALENPLVFHYYKELLRSVGIGVVEIWEKGKDKKPIDKMTEEEAKKKGYRRALEKWDGTTVKNDVFLVGTKKDEKGKEEAVFKEKTLPYFLKKGNGGMSAYIREVIKDKIGDYGESERWAAARLACDIFLVDKYTKWEFAVNKEGEIGQFCPSANWGGDPFRALLEPSFLPRRIKQVYEEAPEILDEIDKAFLPEELTSKEMSEKEIAPLDASVAGVKLKDYARWNEALWIFLGGSRAGGVPDWSPKVREEILPKIAELLDDVYGKKGEASDKKARYLSKEIAGVMMTRIVKTKALAILQERAKPGFKDQMAVFFGAKKDVEEAFTEIEVFLLGPNRDCSSGFFAELAGGRRGFVLEGNEFGAEADINETAAILFAASADREDIVKARVLHLFGKGWRFLVAAGKNVRA